MIDTTFDFRRDSPPGRDPDQHSPTLRRYHRLLWSKPLPNGEPFDLKIGKPKRYFVHTSNRGQFRLSSDTVIPTFPRKASALAARLDETELRQFSNLGYTIGGMMIWPANRIENKMTINGRRGCHHLIADRFDLTIECVRRHYARDGNALDDGGENPLGDVLARYSDFFELFGSFAGFIEHFLLQDLVDGDQVRFAMPFETFSTSPAVPRDLHGYHRYMKLSTEFLQARNKRIAAYSATLEPGGDLLPAGT